MIAISITRSTINLVFFIAQEKEVETTKSKVASMKKDPKGPRNKKACHNICTALIKASRR
jgi:hypothetical protein